MEWPHADTAGTGARGLPGRRCGAAPLSVGAWCGYSRAMASSAATCSTQTPRSAAPGLRPRALARWLFGVAGLVLLMVIVGGITRLTESGLSITEWKPVTGALPPLSDAAWQAEFDKYRTTVQYQALNRGMSLADFQVIYFWEWAHRLLGRMVGLAYALPLAWFAWRRVIPAGYGPRLVALLALGGLQGAIGWWMVQSGLWSGVAVSHLRLAVHLLLALTILAGLVWTALDLLALDRRRDSRPARLRPLSIVAGTLLFVQLLLGALVAGLRAGHAARDWPLMNGRFFPEGVAAHGSWLATLTGDPFLTHFLHRWWAFVAAAGLVVLAAAVVRRGAAAGGGRAALALVGLVGAQILLGILTVVSGVELWLAVAHQGVGAALVAAAAWNAHVLGLPRAAVDRP